VNVFSWVADSLRVLWICAGDDDALVSALFGEFARRGAKGLNTGKWVHDTQMILSIDFRIETSKGHVIITGVVLVSHQIPICLSQN
jgi:hypothetical protein